ncbi:MAG: ADP-ribosylglycohydrolase family protein [Myxococcales bacterium]|nr:ADP-ribosylglycohydrolase family protein [Myxococcales bacterium]
MVFGRWHKCEVSLASPCLSRRHFRIFWDGALLVVEDLGSSGGTFVNDRCAARAVLAPGDVIAWADVWVSVESVEVLSSLPGAPIPTTEGSSLLDKATLDRARAALWGQAIGDALGLATEFMTSDEARLAYPHGLSRYADIVRDDHRSRWPVGAFTDDTDQMLCILESLIACPTVDPVDIGGNIARWAATCGLGIGRTVQRALDRNGFNTDPIAAARQAWEDGRARHAANGAVMRTSVFGVWRLDDPAATPAVTLAAAAGCRVTHYDPRCVASCVAVSLAIRTLVLDPQCDREGLFNSLADICLLLDPRCAEAFEAAAVGSVEALALDEGMSADDSGRIGYTLKALSAGLWALLHATDFASGLSAIALAGGDGDTNAAVAGAILGARFGLDAIPLRWHHELHESQSYAATIERFLKAMGYLPAQ